MPDAQKPSVWSYRVAEDGDTIELDYFAYEYERAEQSKHAWESISKGDLDVDMSSFNFRVVSTGRHAVITFFVGAEYDHGPDIAKVKEIMEKEGERVEYDPEDLNEVAFRVIKIQSERPGKGVLRIRHPRSGATFHQGQADPVRKGQG